MSIHFYVICIIPMVSNYLIFIDEDVLKMLHFYYVLVLIKPDFKQKT